MKKYGLIIVIILVCIILLAIVAKRAAAKKAAAGDPDLDRLTAMLVAKQQQDAREGKKDMGEWFKENWYIVSPIGWIYKAASD